MAVTPIQAYYRRRFPKDEMNSRILLWKTLCDAYFQRYIPTASTVMEIGAGYCEFINNIQAKHKYAVDINPDTKKFASPGVTVLIRDANAIPETFNHTIDIIFMSNFLEHLEKKDDVLSLLTRVKRLLKRSGKLIVLQPNIDLTHEKYWDFFDHNIVLNTGSIREVFEICGYRIDTFIVRFLPYSTKHTLLPISPLLIRLYLSLPDILRPWAGQSLVIASS